VKHKIEASGDLSGFLDVGSAFKGDLSFKETLRIDGKFEGKIRAGNTLVIGESAEVDAEIDVRNVSVSGHLRGTVLGAERVELLGTARCEGDLNTKVLMVKEGALFEGQCSMKTGAAKAPRVVQDKMKTFGITK